LGLIRVPEKAGAAPSNQLFLREKLQSIPRLHRAALPDFCNLGVTLRILLLVNVLMLAYSFAQTRPFVLLVWMSNFLTSAAVVEPVLIFSLAVLCPMRALLRGRNYWLSLLVVLLTEFIVTLGFHYLMLNGESPGFSMELVLHDWIVVLAVTAIVLYYFYLRERAFSPAIAEARLQALQARIRPHFLFNSLNAVLSLIRSEPRQAERTLENLADLFRVLLREERRAVKLSEEIDLCKRYLDIEVLRLGERLQVEWRIDPETDKVAIPPLILQPLAENAVHHGIEPSPEPGLLLITVARKGRQVEIELVNPRTEGRTQPPGRRGNHMALDNVRERLALHYDVEARLDAGPAQDPVTGLGEYRVKITLPARELEAPRVERRA
jgi:two-component system sensor histidine kinase AlgZ